MISRLVILFATTLLSVDLSAQQVSDVELRQQFARGARNEAVALEKIKALGLSPGKTQIFLAHHKFLVKDDAVIDRMFVELKALGIFEKILKDPTNLKAELPRLEEFYYELFESLAIKGYRRLDIEEVRIYLSFMSRMYNVIPAKLCRALVLGEVSGKKQEMAMMTYVFQKMTDREVESYLRNVRKAVLAEVRDFPSYRTVNESQRLNAKKAFEQILSQNFQDHPRSLEIINAAVDLPNASDADACEVLRLSFKSMLEMRGVVAEWQMRSFVEELQ